ncbi:MAG: iron-containing alcohol dehydrogenase, partial [Anaerolineae bacterium]
MWFFRTPEFFFGDDALSQLAMLAGERAYIVTDEVIQGLGFVDRVQAHLETAGIAGAVFADVEPDPSLQTVQRGAAAMLDFGPDWVIGLGGGSCLDAAKAMWILYERPSLDPTAISPFEDLGLRQKARLICIPTTAGTGAEASYGIVLTDTDARRKLTLGSREATPDIAIVDPAFTARLPRQLTADTGVDVLTHAIEGFSSAWANDFTDGLCLQAARLVWTYLPRAVANGGDDDEAREKMANAAAIAGMTLGNSQVALAHALGHAAGAVFKQIPHGRITALFLPYTIEFVANGGDGRYREIAHALDLEKKNGLGLATAVRQFLTGIGQPTSLQMAGISEPELEEALPLLSANVEMDANTLCSRR